jgi:DNA-binding MarR family transcriptional regulator
MILSSVTLRFGTVVRIMLSVNPGLGIEAMQLWKDSGLKSYTTVILAVRCLESAGYVRRARLGRHVCVRLTPAGKQLREALRASERFRRSGDRQALLPKKSSLRKLMGMGKQPGDAE